MHSGIECVLFEPCLCCLQAVNFGLLNANHLQAGEQYGYIDIEISADVQYRPSVCMPLCMPQVCHSPMPIFQDGNRQSSNFPSYLQRNQKERTLQGRDLLLLCKELSTSEFSIGSEVWGKVLGMALRDCSTKGFGSLGSGYGRRDQVYGLGMRVLQTAPRMLRDTLLQ